MAFPSFRRSKQKTNIRKKTFEVVDDDVEDWKDVGLQEATEMDEEPRKSNITSSLSKTSSESTKVRVGSRGIGLSTDMDDTPTESKFRIKRNEFVIHGQDEVSGGSMYNKEALEELKRLSVKPSSPKPFTAIVEEVVSEDDIPDATMILAAKRLREQKRQGLNTIVDDNGKSGLIRDDDDDTEPFEEYPGEKIQFGGKSKAQVAQERRREILDAVGMEVDEPMNDDEVEDWEMDVIRHAAGKQSYKNLVKAKKAKKEVVTPPTIQALPTFASVHARLQGLEDALNASLHIKNQQKHDFTSKQEQARIQSQELQQKCNENRNRLEHFLAYTEYFDEFSNFLDAKDEIMQQLESDSIDQRASQSNNTLQKRMKMLQLWFYKFYDADYDVDEEMQSLESNQEFTDQEPVLLQDEILKQVRHLFDDALEEYATPNEALEKLKEWSQTYPAEYEQAYANLAIPVIMDLYVRVQMIEWDPRLDSKEIESFPWHDHVLSLHNDTMDTDAPDILLLSQIVQHTCIPKIIAYIQIYDPFSSKQTQHLLKVFGQVRDYLVDDVQPFTFLCKSMEDRLDRITQNFEDACNVSNSVPRLGFDPALVEARNKWFWTMFQLWKNLLAWKRYMGPFVKRVALTLLDNQMLAPLKTSNDFEDDLQKFEAILQIFPKDWMSNATLLSSLISSLQHRSLTQTDSSFQHRIQQLQIILKA